MIYAIFPLLVILISYLIPAFLYYSNIQYLTNPLLDVRYVDNATEYAFISALIYILLYIFFQNSVVIRLSHSVRSNSWRLSPFSNLVISVGLALVCHGCFVLGSNGYGGLFHPEGRFAAVFPIAKTGGILFGIASVVMYSVARRLSLLVLVCFCFNAAFYSFTISSRSVAVPFLLASFILLHKRNYLKFGLLFFFAVILYLDAILNRSSLGIAKFSTLANIIELSDSIPYVVFVFYDTFSALQTLSVAFSVGSLSEFPASLAFIPYISPIPSFFMDFERFRQFQSLSYHLGISTGINSDILSETYLWFGWGGCFVAASIYFFMYKLTRDIDWGAYSPLVAFAFFYFCVMSNVASIRASTRPMIYIVAAYMIVKLTRMIARSVR